MDVSSEFTHVEPPVRGALFRFHLHVFKGFNELEENGPLGIRSNVSPSVRLKWRMD